MKTIALIHVFIVLATNCCGQSKEVNRSTKQINQIFTDQRDGHKYELVSTNDRFWFNQNLNFKTNDSECLNDEQINCEKHGRLYSWEEAQNVCPEAWRQPTKEDFVDLFSTIAIKDEIYNSAIYTFPYTWSNFNLENPAGIFMERNGLKHKKKFIPNESFNIWITDYDNPSLAKHIHAYEYRNKRKEAYRLTAFVHNHEKKNSIRYKRKFGVRCVIPISEFNKLSLK